VDGVEWDTRVENSRRLIVRTKGSIGPSMLLEGQAGHDPALGEYCVPAAMGSTGATLLAKE
jgi:hypothetical protein